jgi:cytochrome c-type biogenesis protein CcmF
MLGRGLLGLGLAFAVYAAVAAPASMRREQDTGEFTIVRPDLLDSARRAMVAVLGCVAGAAAVLWYAFFTRDFSYSYVALNTSRSAPPWYTFSALWAGMAGSLLLWCLILSVYAAAFATRRRLRRLQPWAISVLAGTQVFFLTITAGLENPFARLDVVPADGRGLNPLLHSPGMVIHPPMLYTGLIGMIVPFALAVSALVTRQTKNWVRETRVWILVPWLALGTGLVLGGAWAYTELGWGGYWGWDPVENAALMPWLAATAFLHSAMVEERRGMLRIWNVFLVTSAAVLATFGTFLTRSGLLSSVHTFAQSPVGKWFFVFLGIQTIVGIGLLLWRLPDLRSTAALDSAVSKEAAFLANNLVFCAGVLLVLWGTLLPLITQAVFGSQLAVGPPFFNRVMTPLGAALMVLASLGTVVGWRRGSPRRVARRLVVPAAAATAVAAPVLAAKHSVAFAGMIWFAVLLAATSAAEIARAARVRSRLTRLGTFAAFRGLFARNPRRYGGYLVHLGVAVVVIGMAGSFFRAQTEVDVAPGSTFRFAGYSFVYRRLDQFAAPDKDVNLAVVDLYRRGRRIDTLRPQLNFHRNWDQPQSEIAIRTTPVADIYVVLAAIDPGQAQSGVFRVHYNPLVLWVWVGAAIAVLGGLLALLAGRRRKHGPAPAPAEPAIVRELDRVRVT